MSDMQGLDAQQREAEPRVRASLRQLLPYLFQQPKLLILALVLGVLAALTALAQPALIGETIARVQDSKPLGNLLYLLTACVILSAVFSGFEHYTLQRMGENVVLHSRKQLISKILFLPISQFDQRRTGDLVSRIGSDTTLLRAVLTQGLVEAVAGIFVLVGALVGMLLIDAVLFGATAGVLFIASVVLVLISLKMRPLVTRTQQQVGDLAAGVDRAVSGIRTIRAAGAGHQEAAVITEQAEGAYRLGLRLAKLSTLIVPISFISMQLCFLVVFGVGGLRVATGQLEIAGLVSFIILVFLLLTPLGQIFGAVASVNQALGALGRILEITEQQTEQELDTAAEQPQQLASDLAATPNILEFRDVHFSYRGIAPEQLDARKLVNKRKAKEYSPPQLIDTPVLHGVSFAIPRGKRIAIVGSSGSGKSTILQLIERFYDPQQGQILFSGVPLPALDRDSLRAQFGYVEQDAPALAGSIRENLLIGNANASDAECLDALQKVNLEHLVQRSGQEDPLATVVGEKGVLLSGGEKQRLAIARALLSNAPVLLLDESTANLDAVNEDLMRKALDTAAKDRTTIVVAHRLATVVDSDLIIVLSGGVVVGSGTHDELLTSTPLYRELAVRQLLAS